MGSGPLVARAQHLQRRPASSARPARAPPAANNRDYQIARFPVFMGAAAERSPGQLRGLLGRPELHFAGVL